MPTNSEIKAALQSLRRATKGLDFPSALDVIDAEMAAPHNADFLPYFAVKKGGLLWAYGKIKEAADLMEQFALEYDNVDSVHYFAGERLLELGKFERAIPYLTRCIEIAESTGNVWYLTAAYLLRAYSAAKTGDFELARHDLAKQDNDESMGWLKAEPIISRPSIIRMME